MSVAARRGVRLHVVQLEQQRGAHRAALGAGERLGDERFQARGGVGAGEALRGAPQDQHGSLEIFVRSVREELGAVRHDLAHGVRELARLEQRAALGGELVR